jgi:hypothetical protein
MSARRKLTPEEESALMAWYSQYQQALNELKKLGSVRKKARELGIASETLHLIVKRDQYELRRKCKKAGLDLHVAA